MRASQERLVARCVAMGVDVLIVLEPLVIASLFRPPEPEQKLGHAAIGIAVTE